MRKSIFYVFCFLAFSACGQVTSQVVATTGNDLSRTSELASKYGKSEVKQCSDFMLGQVKKLQAADMTLEDLQNEPTNGLFSAALKAALIADALRTFESTNGPEFKAKFKQACSSVAGDVLFNIMNDAAKFRGR